MINKIILILEGNLRLALAPPEQGQSC